jgi:hypothetical protein
LDDNGSQTRGREAAIFKHGQRVWVGKKDVSASTGVVANEGIRNENKKARTKENASTLQVQRARAHV